MRLVTIVGARPQFIKAAMVSRALRGREDAGEKIIHTGQHYDTNMSKLFFDQLSIPQPDYNLGIGSGLHGRQTGQMLEQIEKLLLELKPHCLLVYGDTNSTLAGALAAAKLSIPIAHVEAGLRSFNRVMPEEVNRVLTDHCASYLFAPTKLAVYNLLREGIAAKQIIEVGDVMYDAALYYGSLAAAESVILDQLQLQEGNYILATIHRAENTDCRERLEALVGGLSAAAKTYPVVLPLHPRTKKALQRFGLFEKLQAGVKLTGPLGYLEMLNLEQSAALVATDSGGVQKEAYFYRVPCVTLRDETEWVELVESGWNKICPPLDAARIEEEILKAVGTRGADLQLYGDGRAASKIVEYLLEEN